MTNTNTIYEMPLYIRHLPGTASAIVDERTLPPNKVIFNPSYADPMLYLRGTNHTMVDETNFVMLVNKTTMEQYVIESPMDKLAPNVNLFKGIEDLRICWFESRLWFTGTTTHASSHMTNELVLGYFDKDFSKVERICPLDIGSLPVKNVCPFVWKDRLHLLDAYKKKIYQVYEIVDDTTQEWQCYKVFPFRDLKTSSGVNTESFRGSTSPVHLHGNTWGCVVHDIIFNDNTKLVTRLSYLHHWMEFDIESGMITFISTPFWVAKWGIEYVSGIHKHTDIDKITLFLGVNDRHPVQMETTLHDLRIGK